MAGSWPFAQWMQPCSLAGSSRKEGQRQPNSLVLAAQHPAAGDVGGDVVDGCQGQEQHRHLLVGFEGFKLHKWTAALLDARDGSKGQEQARRIANGDAGRESWPNNECATVQPCHAAVAVAALHTTAGACKAPATYDNPHLRGGGAIADAVALQPGGVERNGQQPAQQGGDGSKEGGHPRTDLQALEKMRGRGGWKWLDELGASDAMQMACKHCQPVKAQALHCCRADSKPTNCWVGRPGTRAWQTCSGSRVI